MAIKDAAVGWARAKPVPAMVAIVAAGLVFGGAVGTVAGFKIEQHRAAAGVNRLKAKVAPGQPTRTTTTNPRVKHSALANERVGTVTAIGADSITLNTTRLGVLKLRTTSATHFEQVRGATVTDIKAGSRAVVTLGGDVLVVAASSLLGRPVTKVAGDSFAIGEGRRAGCYDDLVVEGEDGRDDLGCESLRYREEQVGARGRSSDGQGRVRCRRSRPVAGGKRVREVNASCVPLTSGSRRARLRSWD